MAPTTQDQTHMLNILEDTATLLRKTQANLKKSPKTRLTKGYLEARVQIIDDYWRTFKNAHDSLVKITPKELKGSIPYFLNEEFYIYEDLYNVLRGDLQDMISQLTPSGSTSVPNMTSCRHSNVHLPKIHLPVFEGGYEQFPAFKDLFMSMVHEDPSLTSVQRLHYLKTSLKGEAASLLKNIQVTEDNYALAWETLNNRFGNRRLIVNSLLKRLFSLRKSTSNIQSAQHIKHLLDTTNEVIKCLNNQRVSTDSWDPLIIFLVAQKLDPESQKQWEDFAYKENTEELPMWEDLRTFLQTKFRTLELVTSSTSSSSTREKTVKEKVFHVTNKAEEPSKKKTCVRCKGDHTLSHCGDFAKLSPADRGTYVKDNNICFNCLSFGHLATRCRVPQFCRTCRKSHHTMLHQATSPTTSSANQTSSETATATSSKDNEEILQVNTRIEATPKQLSGVALLATAIVMIRDEHGNNTLVKALIDLGSQASFVSERAVQALKLKRTKINGTITGIGSTTTKVKQATELYVLPRNNEVGEQVELKIKAYIMPTRLTTRLPTKTISNNTWPHLQGLVLADPRYSQPERVDMLLGVDVCAQIMKGEVIKGPPGTPSAQNTSLGWILFGCIHGKQAGDENIISMHTNLDLDDMLRQMWEQDTNKTRLPTPEERKCEELYKATTSRTSEGRYIVKLPTKQDKLLCIEGNTRDIALKRLYQQERRLEKHESLRKEYIEVMEEYKNLDHMEEVPKEELNIPSVYLPYHAIVKTHKETSRVRIVFNASQKGSNAISLNDELLVGPTLQDDLRSLILRWRMKKVCFVADIQKMYRQILVTKEDSDLQRIVWRSDKNEPVKDYRLGRVTFGTASAPYLAVRTLHQVADDEGQDNPDAAAIIKQDFYMDDLMSGKDNLDEAIKTAKDIESILRRGGFVLQKWCSNKAEFLQQFEPDQRSSKVKLDITFDGSIRALGLQWNVGTDKFQYNLTLPEITDPITKRTILSDIQRLFDPLGWLAPSILPVKLLIQKLWLQGITWDEKVDETIEQEWLEIRNSFEHLPDIEIDRWLQTSENRMKDVTVHGFCDASNRGYAAVAYMRVQTPGEVKTTIIAAKTRVAPVKSKSIPRLELNGAVLLSGLLKQIKDAMRIPPGQIYAWTDSTIVLSWLFGDPTKWNTYVRNRVVEILEDIGNHNWYHVQSSDNPADLASRSLPLTDLKEATLWWNGPEWLRNEDIIYSRPNNNITTVEIIETNLKTEAKDSLSTRFNICDSLTELQKVITYNKRFLQGKKLQDKDTAVTTQELDEALKTCIKITQKESFEEDINFLKAKGRVQEKSKVKALNPYLDDDGILRVGGRLRHANLNEDSIHPVILDHDTYLSKLIVADSHLKTLHGGPQIMLGYLRSKYWILKAKNLVKEKFRKCLTCAKQKATVRSQLMGDLPRQRVTPSRAFLHSAVDFAGPFQVLTSKGRGVRTTKAYVCIFICMCTKAIHLELAGDMTSEAFIGCMKRFVSRRGKCAHLWSDRGRNFIGANKELAAAWAESKLEFEGHIAESLALDGTQWHFLPAYSPHMAGLVEAGVKSLKYHMKRILTSNLTYEEFTTLLCEIEACLNSRPLSPIDNQDTDTPPLTPGHFLIGEAPITIPSPNLKDVPVSYLSRWQHLQKLLTDFWSRWQSEYLSRLQQRSKWTKKCEEMDIGQIVLIKGEHLPPGKWPLGRIIEKHPGDDGLTRVYSVKTGNRIVKRSAIKLCPLPIDID